MERDLYKEKTEKKAKGSIEWMNEFNLWFITAVSVDLLVETDRKRGREGSGKGLRRKLGLQKGQRGEEYIDMGLLLLKLKSKAQ